MVLWVHEYCFFCFNASTLIQGLYGSWKVLEFYSKRFPGLESPGKRPLVLQNSEDLFN